MSLDELARRLQAKMRGRVDRERPLAPLTTYRLGGPAGLYLEPADEDDLAIVAQALSDDPDLAVLVLGRGSNLVVSDRGWPGVVIRLGPLFARIERPREGDPEGLLAAGAAPLPTLANWAARRGLEGLEFLVSIPGSVGGAVRMNAGAHGCDVANSLRSVTVLDLTDGTLRARRAGDLDLSYRHSNLSARELVIDATFALRLGEPNEIRARIDGFRRHRAATQPGALQNAGSVFKNPPGDAAGRLVEASGLKGFRVGGAEVSTLHANFFLASTGATAQDVFDLVQEIRARVAERTGIYLEPEVRFVGHFERQGDHVIEGANQR